ncbi:hypothetical protein ACLB2K_066008 [Fragaria x ananassa]
MSGFKSQRWSLKGMTALVTGGTRGIGYAILEELAGLGATVHTCARNKALIDERVREWKNKSFTVNNAAIVTLRGTTDYSLEDFSSMMSSNVESPYHLCQLAHPLLKASGNGSIIFVSSIAGEQSFRFQRTWHVNGQRIKFEHTVAPWAVNAGAAAVEPDEQRDDFRRLIARTPILRLADPYEISSLVTFLCLPAASYINGQVVSIDGGFTVGGF